MVTLMSWELPEAAVPVSQSKATALIGLLNGCLGMDLQHQ